MESKQYTHGKTSQLETFDTGIACCMEESLDIYFGENVKKVILYNFRIKTHLSDNDIVRKPEEFSNFLTSMFGEQGSKIIEKVIMDGIRTAFALPEISSLSSAIHAAQQKNQLKFERVELQ